MENRGMFATEKLKSHGFPTRSLLVFDIQGGPNRAASQVAEPHGQVISRRSPSAATDAAAAQAGHRTRPELAVERIVLARAWFPDRKILVVGDSAYGGRSVLSKLPDGVHLISRVHPKGGLYAPAPPRKRICET